jgi:hypothetical protein
LSLLGVGLWLQSGVSGELVFGGLMKLGLGGWPGHPIQLGNGNNHEFNKE